MVCRKRLIFGGLRIGSTAVPQCGIRVSPCGILAMRKARNHYAFLVKRPLDAVIRKAMIQSVKQNGLGKAQA